MTTATAPAHTHQPNTCARNGCPRNAWRWGHGHCQPHAYALGLTHHRVPAEPTRQHIEHCITNGASVQGIADELNIAWTVIQKLRAGTSKTLRHNTATTLAKATPHMSTMVPILGTQRRIRAWRAAGWTTQEIADVTDIPRWTIQEIISTACRINTIHRDRHNTVAKAFDREPKTIRRPAEPRIAKRNLPLPVEWTNPDDPDENPHILRTAYADTPTQAARELVREHGRNNTAELLGIDPSTLTRITKGRAKTTPRIIEAIREEYLHMHGQAA